MNLTKRQQLTEVIKCGKDPVYFMNTYLKIQHPVKGLLPFKTFPFQDDCIKSFNENRFNIVLKSRQLGLSTLAAAYAVWQAAFYKEKNILIIATKLAVAQNFIRKVKTYIENMPKWLLIPTITAYNKQAVEFSNGSQIKAIPTSEDAGRSEALTLLIVDEAAFVRNFDELWMGLYPTLSTGGRAIILSTPNGVGGQYHDLYIKAVEKQNKFNPIKLMWDVHPERDLVWFERETKNMSQKQISQELLCDFASSGDTFLTAEVMDISRKYIQNPIEKSGPDLGVWFWEYPLEGSNYILSADISRGDSADFSTFHVISTNNLKICAEFKGKISPDLFGMLVYDIARRYNKALVIPENNAYGYTVLVKLNELKYKNLYFASEQEKYKFLYNSENNIGKAGFTTTKDSKSRILINLEESIRNEKLKIPSARLYDELKTFVWQNNKATAMSGFNDDLVMSIAIGCWQAGMSSDSFIDTQIEYSNALLKGMSINKNKIDDTIISPFYNNKDIMNKPLFPTTIGSEYMQNKNSALGDFEWLIRRK